MTQRGTLSLKLTFVFLMFGLGFASRLAMAQEQMSATQDPAQHQEFGQWRTMNSQFPRIQTRARCSYDVKVNGQWTSWWDFQIRSTYQDTTDYVFLIEYGNFGTDKNVFGAPGLVTAKYNDIYTNGTELLGTCHSHPLPNSLFIIVKCAAPTGQDMACFKGTDGKQISQAMPSGSVGRHNPDSSTETFASGPIVRHAYNPSGGSSQSESSASVPLNSSASPPTSATSSAAPSVSTGYYVCYAHYGLHNMVADYVSNVFEGPGSNNQYDPVVRAYEKQKRDEWGGVIETRYPEYYQTWLRSVDVGAADKNPGYCRMAGTSKADADEKRQNFLSGRDGNIHSDTKFEVSWP